MGKNRWPGRSKTIEGSLAYVISTMGSFEALFLILGQEFSIYQVFFSVRKDGNFLLILNRPWDYDRSYFYPL
jgi:hypothetical protein